MNPTLYGLWHDKYGWLTWDRDDRNEGRVVVADEPEDLHEYVIKGWKIRIFHPPLNVSELNASTPKKEDAHNKSVMQRFWDRLGI